MTLFIDGDAFPNKKINIGSSKHIEYLIVEQSADEADNHIVELCAEGDLVITADIPLADRVIAKDSHAINHRGELYSIENIKQYLAMRNLMESIRESGEPTSGPKPFSSKDAHQFANQLHRFLTKYYG